MNIRDEIINAVIKEIVGPDPAPKYRDETTGEEILLASVHGSPKSRYGAGMLYPQQTINNEEVDTENKDDPNPVQAALPRDHPRRDYTRKLAWPVA